MYDELTANGKAAVTELHNAQIALRDELLAAFGASEHAVLRQTLDRLTASKEQLQWVAKAAIE